MKGGVDVSENIETAENTEKDCTEAISEIIVRRKKVTFFDILAVQAIMCLVTAIAFVGVNIFYHDLAADIFDIYIEKNIDSENISNVIKIIADFLQSTPLG